MYKILIVEDDRIIADNVCEQLLKWGYDVKIADDICYFNIISPL